MVVVHQMSFDSDAGGVVASRVIKGVSRLFQSKPTVKCRTPLSKSGFICVLWGFAIERCATLYLPLVSTDVM